ncbi:protein translocase subunit SecF [Candidatus Daviesbacteria bacterium]|nr:protein translocase subunit SecF [Candidatus Daviesbacteria bacterium]
MIDIIGKKYWYLALSAVIIIPGVVSLMLFGLKLGIDFSGGTLLEYKFTADAQVTTIALQETIKQTAEVSSITKTQEGTYLVRAKPMDQSEVEQIKGNLATKFGQTEQVRFETVGPTISQELTQRAVIALAVALLAIVVYIAWAFREVPAPAASWRFGVCAIAALFHDVLVVVGVFSLLGHFWGVEVDSLFVTALLTVVGFSVHDTIVVFDRIRENLRKFYGSPFAEIANISILQTLARSLSTSLTVILVLSALILFGGSSIKWFVTALLIGIISGTYSSIFNATPLLVIWQEKITKKRT